MGYKSETIANTVRKLNQQYFLPAIQRDFVWKPEQIVRLFDSILRGYPISSFLFWELDESNRDKWQAYKFLDTASSNGTRNEIANTHGVSGLHLILDGQQRLTSLNIGLRGFYIEKKKYAPYGNPSSYVRKRLFLNLLHDPKTEDTEASEGIYYEFTFLDPTASKQTGKLWFEVAKILALESDSAFYALVDDMVDRMPETATKQQMNVVRQNLSKLFHAVHKDDVIAYHLEREQDYDRVLDIFVRANSGGTELSKSDLLMSTVTGSWGDIDAREEIQNLLDRLNRDLTRRNNLNKDFVMKSCLVLTDLPVQYKVQNFNHQNLMKIRGAWSGIKQALERGVDAVNQYGIDGDTLTSANTLIPVLYFLHQRPHLDLRGSSANGARNAGIIRRWLASVLLSGAFGGSSDTALASVRNVIRTIQADDDFPATKINEALRSSGRSARTEDVIEAVLELTYGKRATFLALSLFYEEKTWGVIPHHVDHILPRSWFSNYNQLQKEGRPNDFWTKDRIGNLCLLVDKENLEKSDMDFADWIQTRDESFLKRHLIPDDPSLWTRERLGDFVKARDGLIQARLMEVLSSENEAEGAVIGASE